MKTLVITSHPYFAQSRVISALQQTAEEASDVVVRNLDALYGDNGANIDVAAEQAAYADAGRVVFLYPTHWFNLTPMLKAYMNAVWTYGWAFGPGGTALKDKTLQVVTSAGASEYTYSHDGLINSSMEEVLTPIKASALYVGMHYQQPLAFYEVAGANHDRLADFQSRFAAELACSC